VAQICRSTLGPTDVIGRTGGEEFLVLLPATPLPIAKALADRLRVAIDKLDLLHGDTRLHVTISIGVTQSMSADTSLSDITRRADELLYLAKESGRNGIAVA
jgi:diguanylate cyclase (GGDEF)-like protein